MKKNEESQSKLESLSDVHRALGLPKPLHPLISLLDSATHQVIAERLPKSHVLNFYKISFKPELSGKLKYGQGYYDFDEGGLLFAAPNQVIGNAGTDPADRSLYTLLIHPDFLWNYPLAKKIKQYGFFSYSTNEALHVSESEKETILSVFKIIDEELKSRIDDFSQDVIISQIELLLNYGNRFYKRQFITNYKIVTRLEEMLKDHFSSDDLTDKGLPTVHDIAQSLNVSPNYLSGLLKVITGQSTQQHIHYKLIEKAKERLSTTELSVSEIAYKLGFEHPQSFSKLFKTKTNVSPLEFWASFN